MSSLLNKRYRPNVRTSKSDYELSCPIDEDWAKKSQRVLLVIETIDSQDLTEGRLLHDRSHTVVSNLINYSCVQAKREFGFVRKDCAFATINFNSYKFFDQPKETWGGHRRRMAKRVLEIIPKMNPTHVIVFGDWAIKSMMPSVELLEKKRGWVHDLDIDGFKCKITGSLDLQPLYSTRKEDVHDDDDDGGEEGDVYGKANLLFYVSRNVINALAGRNLYDLSHIKSRPKLITTIEEFDKVYEKLTTEEIVAVDTETKNGSVNHNAIHTIQFAFNTKRGYMIPVDHPETPFSEEDRTYIKKKLRKFFAAKPGEFPLKYLITQYGIFDLRVLRVELGIPMIWHTVWEITAGEWCFHPDTLVETNKGKLPINELVNGKYKGDETLLVWSVNRETGEQELKPIINRLERPTPEDMVEIEHEGGTLRVTESHKVWSVTRNCYVMAKDIYLGEELLEFKSAS